MKTFKSIIAAALLFSGTTMAQNIQNLDLTKAKLEKVWETDTSMTTAESVLYDHDTGTLYVSNIDGAPTKKDGNGFISTLNTDGKVKKLKWATGLDAPKGMAILAGKLYVSDIDALVEIDLASGKILKRYPITGAGFLNDVAAFENQVVVSDSQMGTIHALENGKISLLATDQKGINGLAFNKQGHLFSLDGKGLIMHGAPNQGGQVLNSKVTGGDGLIILENGAFIASRWQGEIYLISQGREKLLLDTKDQKSNTADIEYIPQDKLVLVPTFFKNKVVAYRLSY